ncbi:UNVERIFIED_CONTAM: hypothetical protein Sindi_3054900, partial [Sesamum indicum]
MQSMEENQVSQGKGGSKIVTLTLGVPEETFPGGDHGGPKSKARTCKSGQRTGPTRVSSQGSRRADARSTGRTSTRRTFRLAHTPSQMKVLKTAIAGLAEQNDIYLPTARRNM